MAEKNRLIINCCEEFWNYIHTLYLDQDGSQNQMCFSKFIKFILKMDEIYCNFYPQTQIFLNDYLFP